MLAHTPIWLQLALVAIAWAIVAKPLVWLQAKYINDDDDQQRGADE